MTNKLPPASEIPALVEPIPAPLVYFDGAPNFGWNNGVVNITLAANCPRPDGKGHIVNNPIVVADLRCNLLAAKNLRDALNQAILLGETPPGEPN